MIYKNKIEVTTEHSEVVSDETIFRSAIADMIASIPIKVLKDVFNLEKVDPNSQEYIDRLNNPFILDDEKYSIMRLRQNQTIAFLCQLDTDNSFKFRDIIDLIKRKGNIVSCREGKFYNLPQWFVQDEGTNTIDTIDFLKLPSEVVKVAMEQLIAKK